MNGRPALSAPAAGSIVVGVEGSTQSAAALRWAAVQADLTGAHLVAAFAWHVPMPGVELVAPFTDVESAARTGLTQTIGDVLGPERAHDVEARVCSGTPTASLLELAEHADLVVVGAHERGATPAHPFSSIPTQLIENVSCPVAVVRPVRFDHANRIVVGLDGSECSRIALHWALEQAELTGASVDAIVAWEWAPQYPVYPYGPSMSTYHVEAERLLGAEMGRLSTAERSRVAGRVVQGHPATVLTHAARSARLLVVGTHGSGSGLRYHLGSTSLKCVRHADGPVVVTHDD
jgi:nucleotide-binding universal stress UspA family protein